MPTGRISIGRGWGGERLVGAVVAVSILAAILVIVGLVHPFEMGLPSGWDEPEVFLPVVGFIAIVGWWAGRTATRGGWTRAILVGIGVGIGWWPLAVLVLVTTASVDALLRGASPIADAEAPLVWALYGLVVGTIFASAVGIPIALTWGVATRWLARRSGPADRTSRMIRHPSLVAIGSLLLLASTTGAAMALTDRLPDERCLDLGGARPLDGAFSPAGDMLVVITSNDRNAGGNVHLLDWPSGTEIALWQSWVDQDVVVDPHGRVYWSAWEYQDPWRGGVMTAAPGSEPRWLTTDQTEVLSNLTWTATGLRGMTANGSQTARIRLVMGLDIGPRFEADGPATGTFWASADGRVTITAADWATGRLTVTVAGRSPVDVRISGDPRAVAMSADRSQVIVAGWSGGTRRYDIASGRSDAILRRSQTWIAVSAHDEIAWADDEQFGSGRVCVAPLPR